MVGRFAMNTSQKYGEGRRSHSCDVISSVTLLVRWPIGFPDGTGDVSCVTVSPMAPHGIPCDSLLLPHELSHYTRLPRRKWMTLKKMKVRGSLYPPWSSPRPRRASVRSSPERVTQWVWKPQVPWERPWITCSWMTSSDVFTPVGLCHSHLTIVTTSELCCLGARETAEMLTVHVSLDAIARPPITMKI